MPGYQLDMDNITCSGMIHILIILIRLFDCILSDIDECTEDPCVHNCTNTDGSFICSCNNGYELDDNGRSCNGMYIMLIIINCLLLYILCIDIDECLSGPCPPNLMCNNLDGNYSCDCPYGTKKNGTDCICKGILINKQ